jgi:hypothetical protein
VISNVKGVIYGTERDHRQRYLPKNQENEPRGADVDNNGDINAVDASYILSYYAYTSTTKEAIMSLADFMKKK